MANFITALCATLCIMTLAIYDFLCICRILENNGFTILERSKDFNHIERAVSARLDREDVE